MAIHMAIIMNTKSIPKLKSGAHWSEEGRNEKIQRFADALLAYLSGIRFFRRKRTGYNDASHLGQGPRKD